jgi:hypothetical protein
LTLEEYLYEELPYLAKARVRLHLMSCSACRNRLESLRRFSRMLSAIPREEPPAGFLDDLVKSIDTWGVPTPAAVMDHEEQVPVARGPAIKVRWALGAIMFLVSSVLQWQYGDYLPRYLNGSYLSTLKGLQSLWESVRSGALWRSITQVVAAVRTDGISALRILGTTLPTQIAGVVVFGGIVTAVFISQLKASRRKGENRR